MTSQATESRRLPTLPDSTHRTYLSGPLAAVPEQPDLEALEAARKKSERFALHGDVFYFHAPEGFYRSKLAGKIERSLGVAATGRAWSSVVKVMAMAKEMG